MMPAKICEFLYKNSSKVTDRRYFAPLFILILAVIFFPLKSVILSADSGWYLYNAQAIYNDFSLQSLLIWRPAFPFLISLAFFIFGVSVQSAFYLVRFFFVLNLLLCYFIGFKLFNRATGLVFSLFILTSYWVNRCSSYILLDHVVTFFILSYILFVHLAFEISGYSYFIISGILLGFALLIKEVMALPFIFLPLCLFIFRKFRTLRNIKGVFLLYLFFTITISPWLYKAIFIDGSPSILLGQLFNMQEIEQHNLLPSLNEIAISKSIIPLLWSHLAYFPHFARQYINAKFILWPLFYVGLIYAFCSLFWVNGRKSGILVISVLLFTPTIVVVDKIAMRPGQVLLLYFLFYLMMSKLLVDLANIISGTFDKKVFLYHRVLRRTGTVLIAACLLLQIFWGVNRKESFLALMKNDFSFWVAPLKVDGWLWGEGMRGAAEWINRNVEPGSAILCQRFCHIPLNFLTANKYNIGLLKMRELTTETQGSINFGKPLFIWPAKGFKQDGNFFRGYFEEDILSQVEQSLSRYIIVGLRENFLSLYLQDNKSFLLVNSFSGGMIKVYKLVYPHVEPAIGFSTMFGDKTYRYLYRLFQDSPKKYLQSKRVIGGLLRWPKDKVELFFFLIENGREDEFRHNFGYVEEGKVYDK